MSIALDIALYLRDNPSSCKNISLSDRAVLFTLAFRVGSNTLAWVSQEELAKELNLTPRGLRKNLSNLIENKFITVTESQIDKRKNFYHPASFLVNYHQTRKIRNNCSSITHENNGNNNSYKSSDKGTIDPVSFNDKGTDVPLLNHENHFQVHDCNNKISQKNPPKVKYKSKVTLKAKKKEELHRKERDVVFEEKIILPDWIKEKTWSEFLQHRKSIKSPMSDLAQRKAFNILEKFKDEGQDVDQIINNSIVNGWKGLFPIKLTKEIKDGKYYGNSRKEEPFDDLGEMLKRLGCKSIEDLGSLTSIT